MTSPKLPKFKNNEIKAFITNFLPEMTRDDENKGLKLSFKANPVQLCPLFKELLAF